MFWYNQGFYEEAPNDEAIELTEEEYNSLMTKIGNGGELKQDEQGRPYVEDTPEMLDRIRQYRISKLKQNLQDTDYQAIKHSEGLITDEEYEEIKEQRQAWRDEINELEEQL